MSDFEATKAKLSFELPNDYVEFVRPIALDDSVEIGDPPIYLHDLDFVIYSSYEDNDLPEGVLFIGSGRGYMVSLDVRSGEPKYGLGEENWKKHEIVANTVPDLVSRLEDEEHGGQKRAGKKKKKKKKKL